MALRRGEVERRAVSKRNLAKQVREETPSRGKPKS
jgi:hypothetical protein